MTQPEPADQPPVVIPVATRPPYSLHVGPGATAGLPSWLAGSLPDARLALITDSNVMPLHAAPLAARLERAGRRVETFVFEAGEASKTRATKERIEDAMLGAGLGRDTVVLAMGGGVAGDLAGFVAATYLRGVPVVGLPTSLLAMVDASVGGKTGVDHPLGKNLIGAFHQPSAVFADVACLATLPDREYRNGLAEMVKAGVVGDTALLDALTADPGRVRARDTGLMTDLIARACAIKARVVGADEREGDLRKILNFGHTIGHALEAVTGYAIPHGEAVSVGMVAEARIAVRLGLASGATATAIETALVSLGLPTALPPGASTAGILGAARHDKKARGGRTAYALPRRPGEMARGADGYGIAVDDAVAAEVLDGMRPAAGGS